MKQIGLACLSYAQDYDEKLCYYYMYNPYPNNLIWWEGLMQPYIKNWQICVCPSTGYTNSANCAAIMPAVAPYGTSYAYNCFGLGCNTCSGRNTQRIPANQGTAFFISL